MSRNSVIISVTYYWDAAPEMTQTLQGHTHTLIITHATHQPVLIDLLWSFALLHAFKKKD